MNTETKSDTPMTDSQTTWSETEGGVYKHTDGSGWLVDTEFARRLERELQGASDWGRWIKELLTDFKIQYDDHTQGIRHALTKWMIGERAYGRSKDETATVFMNQVKKLQAEIEMLRDCNQQLVASEQSIRNEVNRLRSSRHAPVQVTPQRECDVR